MVTLLDMTDDDMRLIEAFDLLSPAARSQLLRQASIAACSAVLARQDGVIGPVDEMAPKEVARRYLMRCMPPVPTGYCDDFGFEADYHGFAVPMLQERCVDVVLGAAGLDDQHAAEIADDLLGYAMRVGPDHAAPNFEDGGFVSVDAVKEFIEDWRESFCSNLQQSVRRT